MPGNLVLDERLDVRTEAAARHESDFAAEQTLQREGKVDEIVVRRPLEIDEKVDVAASLLLAAGIRAEQTEAFNGLLSEQVLMFA